MRSRSGRRWIRRSWRRPPTWPATTIGRLTPTAMICGRSSSGPLTSDLAVLEATRAHIELYRARLEQRGLAASTIDRRLSTVCGFYRFAHVDGRVGQAQYVRRPKV